METCFSLLKFPETRQNTFNDHVRRTVALKNVIVLSIAGLITRTTGFLSLSAAKHFSSVGVVQVENIRALRK